MKYLLFLAVSVAATNLYPYEFMPAQLETRAMRSSARVTRIQKSVGREDSEKENKLPPDSPKRQHDTTASAKLNGPGVLAVGRSKYHPDKDTASVEQGLQTKATHDPLWSKAEARAMGSPPRNAGRQDARLHPVKVEGSGQSGNLRVSAPRRGYGRLKKVVNGEVVRDERVPSGETLEDSHIGSRPNELQYSGSTSRGGQAGVQVNNFERAGSPDTHQLGQSFQDLHM